MKNNMIRFVLCLAVLLTGSHVFAASHGVLRVSVPFDFTVAGMKMPAGDYAIEETGQVGTLIFHNFNSKRSVMVLSTPGTTLVDKTSPGLTFERHNGVPALTRVLGDASTVRSLPVQ